MVDSLKQAPISACIAEYASRICVLASILVCLFSFPLFFDVDGSSCFSGMPSIACSPVFILVVVCDEGLFGCLYPGY